MPLTRRPEKTSSTGGRNRGTNSNGSNNSAASKLEARNTRLNKTKNTVLMDEGHRQPTIMSYICMFLGLGWMITVPCILLAAPIFWWNAKPLFWLLIGTILVSILYTADRDYQPRWGYAIGAHIMRNVSSYFQFRIEFEDLEAVKNAGAGIYIMEPHGVFPIALFWGSLHLIPGFEMLCCLSSSIFTLPIMKHVLTWCGATTVTKENISRYLKEGVNVNICAGGVQEIYYWKDNHKELVLFLKSRYGVTKLAMSHGVVLVPSLCFGLENAYGCWIISHPVLLAIARKIGFFPMLFTGRNCF
jgi:hypothetical protein